MRTIINTVFLLSNVIIIIIPKIKIMGNRSYTIANSKDPRFQKRNISIDNY